MTSSVKEYGEVGKNQSREMGACQGGGRQMEDRKCGGNEWDLNSVLVMKKENNMANPKAGSSVVSLGPVRSGCQEEIGHSEMY